MPTRSVGMPPLSYSQSAMRAETPSLGDAFLLGRLAAHGIVNANDRADGQNGKSHPECKGVVHCRILHLGGLGKLPQLKP
jgi:hypothetical protein